MRELLIFSLLKLYGFTNQQVNVMMCIGYHESKYNNDLEYINKDSRDIGVFQINDKYWGLKAKNGCGFSNEELREDSNNVKCAKHVFDNQGYRAWIAYRKHKKECDSYRFRPLDLNSLPIIRPYPELPMRF